VQAADCDGSTEFIFDTITAAPAGTSWGVGTEINLVNRLNAELPDKHVFCLDPVICPCSTMYRVHPAYVLWSLEHLAQGRVVNQITVDPETARRAGRTGPHARRAVDAIPPPYDTRFMASEAPEGASLALHPQAKR
jgi:quinolinate synthase